jgi:GrpB-like predicted nucleotidyltransferase (UPF0157 family)
MNVVIVDYDPRWAPDFEALRARIWPAIEDFAVGIEHVGSTSVPGLAAKPALDIDVIVASHEGVLDAVERLRVIGYDHRGNLGIEGREAFRAAVNEPAHHLYVCREDSAALRDHLTFRDYLRANPETAQAYAELKRTLARQFPDDVDRYATAKTGFVTAVLERAGISQARIEHIRRENGL